MHPFSWCVIVTLIYEREALRVQRLTIFSENCCKGKNESFLSNVRNLEEKSFILSRGPMKSFSIHRGLWALSSDVNYTKGGVYYEGNNDDVHGNCGSSASAGGGDFIQYKSMRIVGNSLVDLPGFSLFTKEGFLGEELYFDGTNLRLPSPYVFHSFGFTGRDNWTYFPLTNFTGGAQCLIAQNKVVSFVHKGTVVTLGSLQRGCSKRGKEKERRKGLPTKTLHPHQALILYVEANQIGERLYTDAHELRLPLPLTFNSHSFVGTKNWTIFSRTDLTGQFLCLYNPKSSNIDMKSQTMTLVAMSVGSVRRGCESDPIKELVIPLADTQDQHMEADGARTLNYAHNFMLFLLLWQFLYH